MTVYTLAFAVLAGSSFRITGAILFQTFVAFATATETSLLLAFLESILSTLRYVCHSNSSSTVGPVMPQSILAVGAFTERLIAKASTLEANTI